MFTGLIENIGLISGIKRSSKEVLFTIRTKISKEAYIGQSIAVNGACLTITSCQSDFIQVRAVSETLSKTTLGSLHTGCQVHLERALMLNSRLDGHYVQGHIDGIGELVKIEQVGNGKNLTIVPPLHLLKFIVPKGSIALSGISLTIVDVHSKDFSVTIVPHTLENTLVPKWKVKEKINIEVDIVAKYVEKLLNHKD